MEGTLGTLEIGRVIPPPQFAQLGILVVDGSGSMMDPAAGNISKAQATNGSIRELFTRIKHGRVANNFTFAVVTFDDSAEVRLHPVHAPAVDDNDDYDPLKGHGGGTSIYLALEKAEKLANDFLSSAPNGGIPHSVIILVMSDGVCSDPPRTRTIADAIKKGTNGQSIKIASAFFATVGSNDQTGPALLKDIASDPVMYYKTVYYGESLRSFFERSMSTASGSMTIG